MKDITGNVYGRLTAVAPKVKGKYGWIWECQCSCGNSHEAVATELIRGKVQSCGCLYHESRYTHGMSKTKLYSTWRDMKQRCLNPKCKAYQWYGAKGITICERWMTFENFLEDMGGTYEEGLELDRIDGSLGYNPTNCQWLSSKENAGKLTKQIMIEVDGKKYTINQLAESLNVEPYKIRSRWYSSGKNDKKIKEFIQEMKKR